MIVENAVCELCDEPAIPYDADMDYPFCPSHAIQMVTGVGMDDMEISAEGQLMIIQYRIERQLLTVSDRCAFTGCEDRNVLIMLKHLYAFPVLSLTAAMCARHAIFTVTDYTSLLTVKDWTSDLALAQ